MKLLDNNKVLEMRNIHKSFPGVRALKGVDFHLNKGEIHALMGENGAGKSTLIKVLTGVYSKDEGQIFIDGKDKAVSIHSPQEAQKLGISTVYQEITLCPNLSVAENMYIGRSNKIYQNWKKMNEDADKILQNLDIPAKASQQLASCSIAVQQMVAIARAVDMDCKVLILDEPTAVLTPQESDRLFDILRNMRKDGCSIMIITHKLQEVLALSDRVAILRKGKYIDTVETAQANAQSLSEMMVGGRVDLNIDRPEPENVKKRLVVKGLNCKNKEEVKTLDDVDLTVNAGEILGIAGISGSGQKEFLEAMDYAQASPSLSQAQRLKKLSQEGGCTLDAMCEVMNEIKKDELDHVTIKNEVLRKYFPKSYTPKQMQDTIIRLLEKWQRSKQRDMER